MAGLLWKKRWFHIENVTDFLISIKKVDKNSWHKIGFMVSYSHRINQTKVGGIGYE